MCRSERTRTCPLWTNRRCCVNIGSIRPIGSCGFMALRQMKFLTKKSPNFDPLLDPKCNWAMKNLHLFPVDVNKAPYEMLLRVPGIGVKSARVSGTARRAQPRLHRFKTDWRGTQAGTVFITVNGRYMDDLKISEKLYHAKSARRHEGQLYCGTKRLSAFSLMKSRRF